MEIKVFKFGGASVNSAKGIRNLGEILKGYSGHHLMLIISAMGKTTNALEELLGYYLSGYSVSLVDTYHKIRDYHLEIIHQLFTNKENPVFGEVEDLFDHLRGYLRNQHVSSSGSKRSYDFEYDQIVSYGELISTKIIHHFLLISGVPSKLFDARKLICTDSSFRDAGVDWISTGDQIRREILEEFFANPNTAKVGLTQGFIGSDPEGNTTTLGREGSDFTASIFAFSLRTKEVTIWKDVPGVMNADPKWFKDPVKIDLLSYREAVELAYYGASVIHPKTIKPLENANIRLVVRSFVNPDEPGTSVENIAEWTIVTPIFIRKSNQALISISPRDFSFIVEKNLSQIFQLFANYNVKVNVMQNSAISFTVCIDNTNQSLRQMITELQKNYTVLFNEDVELFTIRHYNPKAIRKIEKIGKVKLEQKTERTVHLVIKPEVPPGSRI